MGLLARLRDYPIARILTSPALRCVQTVAPLSLRRAVRQLADGGLLVDEPLRWAKGSTWVLDPNQRRVVGARYLAPLRLKALAGHH